MSSNNNGGGFLSTLWGYFTELLFLVGTNF
jgi:hypothetical protein